MTVPVGYSLQQSSASESRGGAATSGYDNSGFNVNFGGAGGVTTAAIPAYVWLAVAGVACWVLLRKR